MLISFTVQNLLSFRDEVTLDMRAAKKITAHGYSLIEAGRHTLLPTAAIYGANASGKTNLINLLTEALGCIAGKESDLSVPFMIGNADYQTLPTFKLKVLLTNEGGENYECEYSFNVLAGVILFEELKVLNNETNRFSLVYSRTWESNERRWILKLGDLKSAKNYNKEIKYVSEMEKTQTQLLLSTLGKRALMAFVNGQAHIDLFRLIYIWAWKTSLHEELHTAKVGMPTFKKSDRFVTFIADDKNNAALNAFMRMVNPMIKSVSIEELQDDDAYNLRTSKAVSPKDLMRPVISYEMAEEYKNEFAPFFSKNVVSRLESAGVWQALYIYPRLREVLTIGGILAADELERSFHPLLMSKIISLFTSHKTNPGGGQLIFTTHNALLMSKKNFRQDEIVFVEKDAEGVSSLYRLSDIEGVRSDLDFCKNYILGAFGAVPSFAEDGGTD